jgi:hypothetical protein
VWTAHYGRQGFVGQAIDELTFYLERALAPVVQPVARRYRGHNDRSAPDLHSGGIRGLPPGLPAGHLVSGPVSRDCLRTGCERDARQVRVSWCNIFTPFLMEAESREDIVKRTEWNRTGQEA